MQKKFSTLPYQKKIIKPWGYEIILTPDQAKVVAKFLHINAGCRLSYQYHDEKEEAGILINGKARLLIENNKGEPEEVDMVLNKGYYIAPFQKHRYIAVTDCDIFESSTRESGNTFRIEDDYKRPDETEEIRKQKNRGWSIKAT